MESLINFVQDEFIEKKDFPEFAAGDTITVYYEIREGEKYVLSSSVGSLFKLKVKVFPKPLPFEKMSGTVGVERIFPMNLPALQKIEINKRGKVRRARIYYFRELRGKKARIKERQH